jgi:hypothetical protein
MSPRSLALRRARTADRLSLRRTRLARTRVRLSDGASTTLHVASYDRAAFTPQVVAFDRPHQLAAWCQQQGVRHAVVGGFFRRPEYVALGELRRSGRALPSVPFVDPWAGIRACVHVEAGHPTIARRDALAAEPGGDLLQAGPLLVADGRAAWRDGEDAEGFSAGSEQFDSDITCGRYPRAALALTRSRLLAVACDGRTDDDAGMTLSELTDALLELGAVDALNLDGGGSTSLVYNGRLRNRPREEHGVDLLGGRPIVTAVVFASA